jgi:hypothetical protein
MEGQKIYNPQSKRFITFGGKLHKQLMKKGIVELQPIPANIPKRPKKLTKEEKQEKFNKEKKEIQAEIKKDKAQERKKIAEEREINKDKFISVKRNKKKLKNSKGIEISTPREISIPLNISKIPKKYDIKGTTLKDLKNAERIIEIADEGPSTNALETAKQIVGELKKKEKKKAGVPKPLPKSKRAAKAGKSEIIKQKRLESLKKARRIKELNIAKKKLDKFK